MTYTCWILFYFIIFTLFYCNFLLLFRAMHSSIGILTVACIPPCKGIKLCFAQKNWFSIQICQPFLILRSEMCFNTKLTSDDLSKQVGLCCGVKLKCSIYLRYKWADTAFWLCREVHILTWQTGNYTCCRCYPYPFTPLSASVYLEINETAWLTNKEHNERLSVLFWNPVI